MDTHIQISAVQALILGVGLVYLIASMIAAFRSSPSGKVLGTSRAAALTMGLGLLVIPSGHIAEEFVPALGQDLIMIAGFGILIRGILLDRRLRKDNAA